MRPGYYFIEWWDGPKRCRKLAGQTPADAQEAQRRKANELIGELINNGKQIPKLEEGSATLISDAVKMFLDHVRVHSPDKPKTLQRYRKVMQHFERHMGHRRFVEAITRADVDDYKTKRSGETSEQHKNRRITPRTVNYEISVLRTFFYFLINDRGLKIENPCARFKPVRDQKAKAKRRPPTYAQEEVDRLFAACDEFEKTIFAALLLTGLRELELCFLAWPDVDLTDGAMKVTAKAEECFSPKDYEERSIPIPPDLVDLMKKLPRTSRWVFPNEKAKRMSHLLRRLKGIAKTAKVPNATLHKFRHTYATRLLESGADIVTVQKLILRRAGYFRTGSATRPATCCARRAW